MFYNLNCSISFLIIPVLQFTASYDQNQSGKEKTADSAVKSVPRSVLVFISPSSVKHEQGSPLRLSLPPPGLHLPGGGDQEEVGLPTGPLCQVRLLQERPQL